VSNNATGWDTVPPAQAYPLAQRQAHAEQHLLIASSGGWLDKTSCSQIARTYGIPDLVTALKQMKRGLFPEFVCGDGK
jgi:hypothetical protein